MKSSVKMMIIAVLIIIVTAVPMALAQAATKPVSSSLSPSQASFTPSVPGEVSAAYSDTDGWQNLKSVLLLMSISSKQRTNSVFIKYNQNNNRLLLRNDADTSWSSCTPGAAGLISNSLVSVDCSRTSIRSGGNDLAIDLSLTFSASAAGRSLSAYQRAVDDAGLSSMWIKTGTVTIANTGTPPPPPPPSTSQIPSPTVKTYDWVSYYGSGRLAELGNFGLVDIDVEDGAGNYSTADVATLKAGGSTVVSYLNIGAAEDFRSYWSQASAYKLNSYDGWPGEYWMDVSNPGWRDLIVNTVAPQLVAKGVDGFYLDNIDVVDEYPGRSDIRAGVVELVRQLRAKYPDKIIIGQTWGLTPLGDTGSDGRKMYQYLDGISKEEVNSTYQGGYQKIPVAESDAMVRELVSWRDRGLVVFTLDYATSESLASYDYTRSMANGLRPYVANKDLDRVYQWPFAVSSFR